MTTTDTLHVRRNQMVVSQLMARGIGDDAVLRAMRCVPREKFVDRIYEDAAYEDGPLPIGAGQTISQPYMVAFMLDALGLQFGHRVLEIGAGSGYAAAVLAKIVGSENVYAIERIEALVERARANLADAGFCQIHIGCSDGTLGWPGAAPFDAILVSAGAPEVPSSLKGQLRVGGRMIVPIGSSRRSQVLVRVTRTGANEYAEDELDYVRFVPLIGREGWQGDGNGFFFDEFNFWQS